MTSILDLILNIDLISNLIWNISFNIKSNIISTVEPGIEKLKKYSIAYQKVKDRKHAEVIKFQVYNIQT